MKDVTYRIPYSYRLHMQPNGQRSYFTQVTQVFYLCADKKPYYIDLFKIATRIVSRRVRKPDEGQADQIFVYEPGILEPGDFQPETVLNYDDEIEEEV